MNNSPKRATKRASSGKSDGGLKIMSPVCGAMQELKISSSKRSSKSGLSEPSKSKHLASKVPVDLSAQFVAAVMNKDYIGAKSLCEQILKIDPNHETAKEFLPVINERITIDLEASDDEDEESENDSDQDGNMNDDEEDDDVEINNELTVSSQYQASGVLSRDPNTQDRTSLRESLKTSSSRNKDRDAWR
eukprot:m.16809 g.16809  ORF g.16809 m.16809 type:complete len:190 (+) comp11217_c0_seq1:246-815(+)